MRSRSTTLSRRFVDLDCEALRLGYKFSVMWSGRFLRLEVGARALFGLGFVWLVLGAAPACSGHSETIFLEPAAGAAGSTAGSGGRGGAGSGGSAGASAGRDAGVPDDADTDADDPYHEPPCPDEPAPPGEVDCDIFSTPSGCPEGTGCYPDLVHPFGDGCDQQTLSLVCRPAGLGVEGDLCGIGTGGCAPGYTCIVGAESGKRCLRVCDPNGGLRCPAGSICGETDADGIGVCS